MAVETVSVQGLAGVLDALRKLPPEIVSKAGGPVKLALKKAAEVLRDEAKRNVQRIVDTPNKSGKNESTGLLMKSIQAKRSRMRGGERGEAFVVGIKRGQRYPQGRQGRKGGITAVQVGRLLEYGTERRQPMPWLRPAFDAKKGAAVQTFVAEMRARTQKVIDRVEREARAKG